MDTETPESRTAVFALTAGGALYGKKLVEKIGACLYLPERLKDSEKISFDTSRMVFFKDFNGEVRKTFYIYRELIFIMAAGIVVRTIAPLLVSKYKDPAIVVMDETGEFAVSLLSGHAGGANRLCRKIASASGSVPVITTATDVNEKLAVDELSGVLDCVPVPKSMVKKFNRALAEGEDIKLNSKWPVPKDLAGEFSGEGKLTIKIAEEIETFENNCIYMLPRNLVAGIGCRRNTPGETIIKAVEYALKDIPRGRERLRALATASVKEDEKGIYYAARYFDLPVKIVPEQSIEKIEADFEQSEFVKRTIGVGGVCEPAAVIASDMGKILIPKTNMGPVTIAVARGKLWWWG